MKKNKIKLYYNYIKIKSNYNIKRIKLYHNLIYYNLKIKLKNQRNNRKNEEQAFGRCSLESDVNCVCFLDSNELLETTQPNIK